MPKQCLECKIVIVNTSKQAPNQKYCNVRCKNAAYRKRKSKQSRISQRRSNLIQNDAIIYILRQCIKAKTVQILEGHTLDSFIKLIILISTKYGRKVNICHIAPVKGKGSTGLLHDRNIFHAGAYQNKKFRNKYYSGGLKIDNDQLLEKWSVTDKMSNNDVLLKIEEFLGDIVSDYIAVSPVRKSKRAQIANKIISRENCQTFDDLMERSYTELADHWAMINKKRPFKVLHKEESKYIAYMDSLTRFILYGGKRKSMLVRLRKILILGYMALNRISGSETYNKYFYVGYAYLIKTEYVEVMMAQPELWSELKDIIYDTVFEVLQGADLNINKFRKTIMSYLIFPEKAWQERGLQYYRENLKNPQ